ncbi:MAG TPA: hypothetical protein VMY76_11780 [Gemmatimonadales bacterium]|nr:hypothetical protein [Gemmatimonadales bacterium]
MPAFQVEQARFELSDRSFLTLRHGPDSRGQRLQLPQRLTSVIGGRARFLGGTAKRFGDVANFLPNFSSVLLNVPHLLRAHSRVLMAVTLLFTFRAEELVYLPPFLCLPPGEFSVYAAALGGVSGTLRIRRINGARHRGYAVDGSTRGWAEMRLTLTR